MFGIVVLDEAGTDDTLLAAQDILSTDVRVRVLHREKKQGAVEAMVTG